MTRNSKLATAVILAAVVLISIITVSCTPAKEPIAEPPSEVINGAIGETILFYPADYSKNIYNDEAYMELIEGYALEFTDGDSSYKLPREQLERYGGALALFFDEYFTDIRNGDADDYKAHFHKKASSYTEGVTEFTMQQIYDISIKVLEIKPTLDSADYGWIEAEKLEPVFVDVRYKIRENNGTFRFDIGSDTVKPQLYMLLDDGDTYKIVNIINYEPIYS